MRQGEVRAHQRVLGRVDGLLTSEVVQARDDGEQLVLIGGDRGVRSEYRLGMLRRLCLLMLDGFGERGTAANVAALVVTIVVTAE
jgi:hypothetical protein